MNKIESKYILPNAITATNMFLGFLSITMSIKENYSLAAWLILLAMVFDALDGLTARKLNAFSEFGKEFDSFCDSVSFGLAPGILIFSLLSNTANNFPKELITPLAFIYALAGVVRLVKFNVVTTASDSKDDFSGMPIPNAANLVVSYFLFAEVTGLGVEPNILAIVALGSAVLMVSTIPFKIPQKIFSFIPQKMLLFVAIAILATAKYSLFPLGLYYVLANLFIFFSSKDQD
ncbi:MAG: CDP-diacylglycerol--serine O-phosphatidyltransferase [Psychrilyobacter sp.]|uniref:CDP-diacylglycerol--serine O-phosphatidyltransferase n=1 Tax=Psychrilyobacter sp. TaxID=2586924 RepID=UPI003C7491B9